jgi:hypothetical protein
LAGACLALAGFDAAALPGACLLAADLVVADFFTTGLLAATAGFTGLTGFGGGGGGSGRFGTGLS